MNKYLIPIAKPFHQYGCKDYLPLDQFAFGLKDLSIIALANINNSSMFVHEVFQCFDIENHLPLIKTKPLIANLLKVPDNKSLTELSLLMFFEEYVKQIKNLINVNPEKIIILDNITMRDTVLIGILK